MTADRTLFAGLDPGKSGGFTIMNPDGLILNRYKLDNTEVELSYAFALYGPMIRMCYIEKVASMPTDGVRQAFSFGRSQGFLFGMLTAYKVPFEEVRPLKWMSFMDCQTGGDKNVSKRRAEQLWPDLRWTHAFADSALIAEFCRRRHTRTNSAGESNGLGNREDAVTADSADGDGEEISEAGRAIREWDQE